jgi:uncharacterized OsmC-like protein
VTIANAVARARAYLTDHPDEARYRDSAATAVLTSGLRVEVSGPGGEAIATDMPAGIGGSATAPSPGWLMRAATASCVASLIAIRASSLGVALERIEVTVDSESDDRGILDLDDAIPAGALSVGIETTVAGPDRDRIGEIVDWAIVHCPVTDTIVRAVPVKVEVR